jgi:hypothetical protein
MVEPRLACAPRRCGNAPGACEGEQVPRAAIGALSPRGGARKATIYTGARASRAAAKSAKSGEP